MVKLIYGQDEYRAKRRVGEIVAEFLVSDPQKMNLEQIDGTELTYGQLDRAISTMPFLSDKRMVIISNFLTRNKDTELKSKVAERLEKISKDCDLVFFDQGEPDKRISLFKKLSKRAEYFAPLAGAELDRFIIENVKAGGMEIEFPAVRILSAGIGADLNRLTNEIAKLVLFAKSRGRDRIMEADVAELTELDENANVFHFIESLSSKNSKKAPEHLYNLINSGENELKVLSMIVYQYRNLIVLKDFIESGEKPVGLAAKAKMHPFVVQKTLPILRHYTIPVLAEIYAYLQDTDLKTKTGEIEPKIALDMVVAKLAM